MQTRKIFPVQLRNRYIFAGLEPVHKLITVLLVPTFGPSGLSKWFSLNFFYYFNIHGKLSIIRSDKQLFCLGNDLFVQVVFKKKNLLINVFGCVQLHQSALKFLTQITSKGRNTPLGLILRGVSSDSILPTNSCLRFQMSKHGSNFIN